MAEGVALGVAVTVFVAAATSATFAVVSGGVGCLVALGLIAVAMPQLRRYRVSDPAPVVASTRD